MLPIGDSGDDNKSKPNTPFDYFLAKHIVSVPKHLLPPGVAVTTTLQRLYLQDCSLRDEGIVTLARSLIQQKLQLQVLNVARNNVSDKGACALALTLTSCMAAGGSLYLYENEIGGAGATALIKATNASGLHRLWVWGNPATPTAWLRRHRPADFVQSLSWWRARCISKQGTVATGEVVVESKESFAVANLIQRWQSPGESSCGREAKASHPQKTNTVSAITDENNCERNREEEKPIEPSVPLTVSPRTPMDFDDKSPSSQESCKGECNARMPSPPVSPIVSKLPSPVPRRLQKPQEGPITDSVVTPPRTPLTPSRKLKSNRAVENESTKETAEGSASSPSVRHLVSKMNRTEKTEDVNTKRLQNSPIQPRRTLDKSLRLSTSSPALSPEADRPSPATPGNNNTVDTSTYSAVQRRISSMEKIRTKNSRPAFAKAKSEAIQVVNTPSRADIKPVDPAMSSNISSELHARLQHRLHRIAGAIPPTPFGPQDFPEEQPPAVDRRPETYCTPAPSSSPQSELNVLLARRQRRIKELEEAETTVQKPPKAAQTSKLRGNPSATPEIAECIKSPSVTPKIERIKSPTSPRSELAIRLRARYEAIATSESPEPHPRKIVAPQHLPSTSLSSFRLRKKVSLGC